MNASSTSTPDAPWLVVTGTSSGIGAAMLTQIPNTYRVLSIARRSPAVPTEHHVCLDISDLDAPGWEEVRALLSGQSVQGVAHLAGELGERGPLIEQNPKTWGSVFGVTLSGMLQLTQICWPGLTRSGNGRVVLATSGAARNLVPNVAVYGVAKAAMERFAQALAIESGDTGPRVVVVNPGPTATPMRAKVVPDENPATLPSAEQVAQVYVDQLVGQLPAQGDRIEARQWLKDRFGLSFG